LLRDGEHLAVMRAAANQFALAHQGAAERMLDLIERWTGRAAR
jgi:3-deoxy-D-manno-octulosonic-acid transferase